MVAAIENGVFRRWFSFEKRPQQTSAAE